MCTSRLSGTEGACPPPAQSARAEGTPSARVRDEPCACRRRRRSAVTLCLSCSFPRPGPAHLLALLRPTSLFIQGSADAPWSFSHSGDHAALLLGLPPRPCSPPEFCPRRTQSLWICLLCGFPSSGTLAHGSPSSKSPPSGRETPPLRQCSHPSSWSPGCRAADGRGARPERAAGSGPGAGGRLSEPPPLRT